MKSFYNFNSIFEELRKFKSEETIYNKKILTITNSLIPLWLDDNIMKLLSSYFGRQFYVRDYPAIMGTYVPDHDKYKINNSGATGSLIGITNGSYCSNGYRMSILYHSDE